MTDTTYNGWSNYATWRINLEIFDGFDPSENGFSGIKTDDTDEVYDFAEYLKGYAEECLFACADNKPSLVEDYARAFLSDVNWHEIAKNLVSEYSEEVSS